jgi:hypothetical protein
MDVKHVHKASQREGKILEEKVDRQRQQAM